MKQRGYSGLSIKVGSMKYYKGRRVEGHWIFGMIEDGSDDLRIFVCENNRRRAEDLIPIIRAYVESRDR